jgi:SARP family transcriptional regulator, regulator of embCAB operon
VTTLGSPGTRIQLCGKLVGELDGQRVEDALPGRQGRLLFGYLVTERLRPVRRETLIDLLWPGKPPDSSGASLRPLISRMRHILGDRLSGRSELRLLLPPDARVDIERVAVYLHDAESAVSLERWRDAWMPAQIGWSITSREFLSGCDGEWVQDRRRRLEDDHLRALQCIAVAGLHLGPAELPDAERAARSLIELAPYRESGYGLLMRALELRGDVAEALLVHDRLRRVLRDELGLAPSREVQHVVERLLTRR